MLTAGVILAGREKHRADLSTSIYLGSFQEAKREGAVAPVLPSPPCCCSFKQCAHSRSPPRKPCLPALNKHHAPSRNPAGTSSNSTLSSLSPHSRPMQSLTLAATFWVWFSTREWFGKIFPFILFFMLLRKPVNGVRELPSQLDKPLGSVFSDLLSVLNYKSVSLSSGYIHLIFSKPSPRNFCHKLKNFATPEQSEALLPSVRGTIPAPAGAGDFCCGNMWVAPISPLSLCLWTNLSPPKHLLFCSWKG